MQRKSTLEFQPRRALDKSNDRRERIAGPRTAKTKYPDEIVRKIHRMRDRFKMSAGAIHAALVGDGIEVPYGWVRSVYDGEIRRTVR